MKMSAFGLAFSARMRVWSSPAAASGSRSTSTPVTAALNAFTNSLFVDSFSAEYTEMRPDGLAVALAAAAARDRRCRRCRRSVRRRTRLPPR